MNRLALRLLRFWSLLGALALLGVACHEQAGTPTAGGPTPEQETQRQARINQNLLQLQAQVTQLNQQIAQLQQEQQQRLKALYEKGASLSVQIAALQQSLITDGTGPAPATRPTPAVGTVPARTAPPAGATAPGHGVKRTGRFLVRLIAVVVVVGALWFMVKILVGRWGDEEDDEDDDLLGDSEESADAAAEELGEEEIVTEEGTIRISPAVRKASGEAGPAPAPAPEESDAEPEPPKA